MTAYVAFLRAINLGKSRKFAKDDIVAATIEAGFGDVETYINTGNVRLSTSLRSRASIEAALESSYAARTGFEVPTVSFTAPEVAEIADQIAGMGHDGKHFVSLLKNSPEGEAAKALRSAAPDGESVVVCGRAVHLLLGANYRTAKITNTIVERHLGTATNRAANVITTIADRWCR